MYFYFHMNSTVGNCILLLSLIDWGYQASFWRLNKVVFFPFKWCSSLVISSSLCDVLVHPDKEQCVWHYWVLFGYERSMRTDKSWQGDQSPARPDQNPTPDTVVVNPHLGNSGKEISDRKKASLFIINSVQHQIKCNCMCNSYIEN